MEVWTELRPIISRVAAVPGTIVSFPAGVGQERALGLYLHPLDGFRHSVFSFDIDSVHTTTAVSDAVSPLTSMVCRSSRELRAYYSYPLAPGATSALGVAVCVGLGLGIAAPTWASRGNHFRFSAATTAQCAPLDEDVPSLASATDSEDDFNGGVVIKSPCSALPQLPAPVHVSGAGGVPGGIPVAIHRDHDGAPGFLPRAPSQGSASPQPPAPNHVFGAGGVPPGGPSAATSRGPRTTSDSVVAAAPSSAQRLIVDCGVGTFPVMALPRSAMSNHPALFGVPLHEDDQVAQDARFAAAMRLLAGAENDAALAARLESLLADPVPLITVAPIASVFPLLVPLDPASPSAWGPAPKEPTVPPF